MSVRLSMCMCMRTHFDCRFGFVLVDDDVDHASMCGSKHVSMHVVYLGMSICVTYLGSFVYVLSKHSYARSQVYGDASASVSVWIIPPLPHFVFGSFISCVYVCVRMYMCIHTYMYICVQCTHTHKVEEKPSRHARL